jgi:hypothetical protein
MNTPRYLLIALTLVLPAGALAADAVDAGAAAKEAPVSLELAAMPLRSSSDKVDAKLVSVLSELVLAQISEDGRFTRLISGSDLAELINLEQQKQALGCEESSCMTELAKALEVPYLLVGEIGLIGQQTVFNLKILDVKNAKVVAREGGVAETTDQAPKLAKDITAKTLTSFFASVSPDAVKRAQERAADAQDIAVLDLEAVHGVKPSMAEVLSDILLSRLTESRRFKSIVAGEDLRDMISLEEQKQAIGCDDESCMTALGGALGVPLMAVPSIGRIGDQFILNFKVINVDDAKVLVRKTVSVRKEVDLPRGVLTLTEDALKALFGEDATMTAQQLERRFTRRIMRRSALVLGVGAIGSLSWSLVDLGGAQAAHDDPISGLTTTTYDNLKAAQGVAVVTRWSAIGGAALATALWALAPAIDAP